ncbi:type VI secretion system-associated protein TagF [Malonomonas rubra]|uniref:type VI secretion system-associated protein TagF n=1 Tax=Malonomonas rubra TaxID=57040 RepID=UPI0026EBB4CD|nr:type VI secretion system-associated protein TagF [Malonomonas rubra]
MLGLRKYKPAWNWIAHGKHPVAGDYFTLGVGDSLTKTICSWLDRGYQPCCQQGRQEEKAYSWRFWLKSPRKGALACGILKNSSDRSDRSYPLLIMGHGNLNGWEKNLQLLPLALEKTWVQMEFISVQRYAELSDFEREIARVPAPGSDWDMLANAAGDQAQGKELLSACDCSVIERNAELFSNLPTTTNEELDRHILGLLMMLKTELAKIPTAIFIGGNMTNSAIYVLNRSLVLSDLKKLIDGKSY